MSTHFFKFLIYLALFLKIYSKNALYVPCFFALQTVVCAFRNSANFTDNSHTEKFFKFTAKNNEKNSPFFLYKHKNI